MFLAVDARLDIRRRRCWSPNPLAPAPLRANTRGFPRRQALAALERVANGRHRVASGSAPKTSGSRRVHDASVLLQHSLSDSAANPAACVAGARTRAE